VETWRFLTNHARVLLCIARDPGVRLRDVAASLGITERSAHAIVADLAAAGYLVKHKHGRRNRYQIQAYLPLPERASQEPAIGDVLALLTGHGVGPESQESAPGRQHASTSGSDHQQSPGTSQRPGRAGLMPEEPRATGTGDERHLTGRRRAAAAADRTGKSDRRPNHPCGTLPQ
jgi:MarR family